MTGAARTATWLAAALVLGALAARGRTDDGGERARLESLGYVTWTDAGGVQSGVTRLAPGAAPGLAYYCSEPSETVRFLELSGREVLALSVESGPPFAPENRCKAIEPYDAHSLLVLHERTRLARVALDGRMLWRLDGGWHHDVALAPHGRIVALRDELRSVPEISARELVLDTEIVTISGSGEILDAVSLAPILRADPLLRARLASRPPRRAEGGLDPFHVNSIEVVSWARHGSFRPGELLIGVRELDAVAAVDLGTRRVTFRWGPGELQRPHHPSLLPNGNLLIFDNGARRRQSRVLELEPRSGRVVWSYGERPEQRFFTQTRGGAQALANGNVLITESERGRAFEVTRAGEIVWEFWNPDTTGAGAKRATIHRMLRLEPGATPQLALPAR